MEELRTLIHRRDLALGAGSRLFYREPLHIVSGNGVELTAADGRTYIDLYNNVPCVGHAHPRVVDAMRAQASRLNVHSRYLHESIVELAERLAALHGPQIESVVFSCTGTEANEVAVMMARAATGAEGIVCSDAAYHGNSTELGKLTYRRGRSSCPEDTVRAFPFPDSYRPIVDNLSPQDLEQEYLKRLRDVVDGFAADGIGLAGMLVCPIFANEGLPNVPANFLAAATEIIHSAGGVVIADEVQAGYCRTGTWWGYEAMGFEPDIVVTGKPMGNGFPLAATAASRELVEGFRSSTHYFNTFAGSPLQAAVGNAVVDVIEDEDLAARVRSVGGFMRSELMRIQKNHPQIGEVRGHGSFIGVDWVESGTNQADREGAASIVDRVKERGFLISNAGALGNVLKVRPPLVFEQKHAELFIGAFEETLDSLPAHD